LLKGFNVVKRALGPSKKAPKRLNDFLQGHQYVKIIKTMPKTMKKIIVQKYGGTSVGSIERILSVAKRVIATHEAGNNVVVVVSAMKGQTDNLINMAYEINMHPSEREMDMLLATGEQVTIALLAMAIQRMGHPAISMTGSQANILTDMAHTKARIMEIPTDNLIKELENGKILIVAGFQGVTASGDITTLGRGGSDTSAVALAAALEAEICEIYTDVDGVFTTDPNIVPEARKIDRISYEEMLEMASLGAKVLQIRSVEFAMKYGVPIHVRSSFNDNPGTIVTREEPDMEQVLVQGVTYSKNEAKVTVMGVPDRPGIAATIFNHLSDANIIVDMIIQNISEQGLADISFTVLRDECQKALQVIESLIKEELGAKEVQCDDKIAKVSIVGVGMKNHSGVAAKMFDTLAKEGINILMISTSEIAISCVIDSKYTELAVRALHEAFELEKIQSQANQGGSHA
jgi:aspartate kinase